MNDFLAMLSSSVGRAHYGFNHVKSAADSDAVETLLMSDSVFRIRDFVARRKYVDLVEQVSRVPRHLQGGRRDRYLEPCCSNSGKALTSLRACCLWCRCNRRAASSSACRACT